MFCTSIMILLKNIFLLLHGPKIGQVTKQFRRGDDGVWESNIGNGRHRTFLVERECASHSHPWARALYCAWLTSFHSTVLLYSSKRDYTKRAGSI